MSDLLTDTKCLIIHDSGAYIRLYLIAGIGYADFENLSDLWFVRSHQMFKKAPQIQIQFQIQFQIQIQKKKI